MNFTDYRARYAAQSTYSVGDQAYWDTNESWGKGVSFGEVVKVTKTTVTVAAYSGEKVFRWQPSRSLYVDKCGWNDYNHHQLITPEAAKARYERYEREQNEKAFRNVLRTAAAKASDKWASVEVIEEAIADMQVQLENLKALQK